MRFEPKFSITAKLATSLMRIEAARQAVADLPITSSVLASLRETARLYSTHYSTMIEGNRLTQEQVSRVIEQQEHFAGREGVRRRSQPPTAMAKTSFVIAAAAALSTCRPKRRTYRR
jgi:Fic family protein